MHKLPSFGSKVDCKMDLIIASRKEVMSFVEPYMLKNMYEYLKPVEELWQPADLLPDSSKEDFLEQIKDLQGNAENLSYDLLAVLIGDTITEEALPSYESWLAMVDDTSKNEQGGWLRWLKAWTSEENRHGDALNRYLYLCGRVNMRQMEISTAYLLTDGIDVQTGRDPYRNFIYTSFQEMATNVSHRRVASLAKQSGDTLLSKMCGVIAGDEARHAKAYKNFMQKIFEVDPNEAMLAFEDMMRKRIVMPASFLRELGGKIGDGFIHFTESAQRTGVYTALDYIDIFRNLIEEWKIETISDLHSTGEKARDYILALPDRLTKVAERTKTGVLDHKYSWIFA